MSDNSFVPPRVTLPALISKKKRGEKITMLTAYDFPSAVILDQSEVDVVLVGDSLAMVVLGHENTLSIGMDEMIYHARAVSAVVKRALVVGDMPYGSYQDWNHASHSKRNAFYKRGRMRRSETGRRQATRLYHRSNGASRNSSDGTHRHDAAIHASFWGIQSSGKIHR